MHLYKGEAGTKKIQWISTCNKQEEWQGRIWQRKKENKAMKQSRLDIKPTIW